ncbi:Auxin-responsive protein [Heracleum sosnowskyi]|uniref:Auxin-responsive protein n=1 Tax=Heracleum sosnowskyi TaxID=360622 RepID=A0AAD8HAG8_9APIA|nr:Auxin-responsive protein [Heracleum sosnowskyi]
MESIRIEEKGLNLEATELRLGLPGRDKIEKETISSFNKNKRAAPKSAEDDESKANNDIKHHDHEAAPAAKAQVIGWPPIRSYRKNNSAPKKAEAEYGNYVKVSMDGAPFLRKIDLKVYNGYSDLLQALENMFKLSIGEYSEREGYKGSEHAPTYEDKDGDWMLVGDVPWDMFISSCKRLRIMKGSDARGLGCSV